MWVNKLMVDIDLFMLISAYNYKKLADTKSSKLFIILYT